MVFVSILSAADQIQDIIHYYVTCYMQMPYQWAIGIQVLKVFIHLYIFESGFLLCSAACSGSDLHNLML